MKYSTKNAGIALAVAAAGLLSACNDTKPNAGTSSAAELVHCYGVNKCGGHNDCKTANNACKGHAACKGQGFVNLSEDACSDVGGKIGA